MPITSRSLHGQPFCSAQPGGVLYTADGAAYAADGGAAYTAAAARRLPSIGQDLAAGYRTPSCRTVGALIAAVLQAITCSPFPQHVRAEVPLVLVRHLYSQCRAVVALLLCHSSSAYRQSTTRQVLVLVEVVDLEQVLGFKAETFTALQKQLGYFPLFEGKPPWC